MAAAGSGIQSVFENLWRDYVAFNPQAKRIYDLILAREQKAHPEVKAIVNDHVALRTYDVARIGLDRLASIFKKHGYREAGSYSFKEKKLEALHFEHADETLPTVFISELKTGLCSELVQKVARAAAAGVPDALLEREELLWSRRQWKASHATYQQLLAESEYAAWMYAFGFRSNHFTIAFNSLKTFKDLNELNAFVRSNGYALNSSGGEIKGTPQELLEQSSTMAEKAKVEFEDGVFEIPSCYYEFARRYAKPDGKLYTGFIAASADKIFESTNVAR